MRARDVLLFVLLLLVLLAAVHVAPPIATRGEAREGLVVRELVAGGDWVLPHRLGRIASKPPLYHWLAAAVIRIFGESDTIVRLPSVLAGWAVALETFALGLLMSGRGVGWLAVGILFAAWGFWRSALEARVDMLFTACVGGAIVAFAWWALRDSARGRALAWVASAAAVLTKGPIGFVLTALVALSFLVSGGQWRRVRALWSWPAAATALLLVGGWYSAAVWSGGRAFVDVQLMKENLDRFAGRGEFAARRAFAALLMARYFVGHLAPWNLAILDDARRWWRGTGSASAAGRLLHCWWLVVLVVFSVAAGKRSVYLLPLYPAIALLAARSLWRAAPSPSARALVAAVVGATALVMLVAAHVDRVRDTTRHGLVQLAHDTAALLPPDASLFASTGLPENDVLVLAYLLRRPLMRERITCQGSGAASYYLRPVPSGAVAIRVERLAVSGGVELVRCPMTMDASPGVS
jgi:4-amino-4-deoxy-L-arabinose transferase-like glycosyltransferase